MEQRERLRELLERVAIERDCPQMDEVADYLLANGVIVPPCKVGDELYFIYKNKVFDLTIEKIVQTEAGLFLVDEGFNDWYLVDEIGKTLYLTREEAERELERKIK